MALTREQFIQAVMEYSRAMFRAARAILDGDADAEDAVAVSYTHLTLPTKLEV